MIQVLIVDDQQMIRLALRPILEAQEGIAVVGEAEDGRQAVALVEHERPDVVLMDIRMPSMDGVEATRRIRERHPAEEVRILVLTTFEEDELVLSALQAGANGFLSKAVGPAELAAAIRDVAAGGGAPSPAAQTALIGHVAEHPAPSVDADLAASFEALTPREREIVLAAATGLSNEDIGTRLFLSPLTVKTHANRAMAKVGARDRAQLVAFAYRAGIVS